MTRRKIFRGFSLAEMMVVLAIFAVLSIVLGDMISNGIKISRHAETQAAVTEDLDRALDLVSSDLRTTDDVSSICPASTWTPIQDPFTIDCEKTGTTNHENTVIKFYHWEHGSGQANPACFRIEYTMNTDTLERKRFTCPNGALSCNSAATDDNIILDHLDTDTLDRSHFFCSGDNTVTVRLAVKPSTSLTGAGETYTAETTVTKRTGITYNGTSKSSPDVVTESVSPTSTPHPHPFCKCNSGSNCSNCTW